MIHTDHSLAGKHISFEEGVLNEVNERILQNTINKAETYTTNNSLMVYTSGTNNMQIDTIVEDRTMITEEKLNKVTDEIDNLRGNLNKEARIVGGVLLQAEMNAHIGLTKNPYSFLSEDWKQYQKMQENQLDMIHEGKCPEGVRVTLMLLPTTFGADKIRLTEELEDAIDAFEDYIQETYALPMMKLKREKHALEQIETAERTLDGKDSEFGGLPFFW